MKRILFLLLLLLFCTLVKAQSFISVGDEEYKTDTIQVLMLVSLPTNKIELMNGYETRKITIYKAGYHQSGDAFSFNNKDEYHYSHDEYLDKYKKPIAKNIMIWQVK